MRGNGPVPLYRFEIKGGGFLYSSQTSDVATLQAGGNTYYGSAVYVYPIGDASPGLTPIYRLVHPAINDNLLAISGDEIASAVALVNENQSVIEYGFDPADERGVGFQNAAKNGIHF